MQKKNNKIRVVYHQQKYVKPKPNCPHCHKGFLEMRVYVEVATEDRDEERGLSMWSIASESAAEQSVHLTLVDSAAN